MPQQLALFNGDLSAAVQNPWSALMRAATEAEKEGKMDPHSVTEAVFRCILPRPPTAREIEIAAAESPESIASAFLNTAEFLFIP